MALAAALNWEPAHALADGASGPILRAVRASGHSSVIVLPLRAGGEVAGLIVGAARSEREFQADQHERAELLAAQAGAALGNLQRYEDVVAASLTDALTGLPNHRRFHEDGAALLDAARAAESSLRGGGRRPRRLQGPQRPARARGGRRRAAHGRAPARPTACGRTTAPTGWAARSSRCCCRRRRRRTPARSAAACSARWPPSTWTAGASRSRSAWRPSRRTASPCATCWWRPTRRSTRRSAWARTASRWPTSASRPAGCAATRWPPAGAARSSRCARCRP